MVEGLNAMNEHLESSRRETHEAVELLREQVERNREESEKDRAQAEAHHRYLRWVGYAILAGLVLLVILEVIDQTMFFIANF
jgi:hypothetical protein